jgi:hypothetical protein
VYSTVHTAVRAQGNKYCTQVISSEMVEPGVWPFHPALCYSIIMSHNYLKPLFSLFRIMLVLIFFLISTSNSAIMASQQNNSDMMTKEK